LTPERRAALEAEAELLIAELKRRYADRGIAGVSTREFTKRWRGVRVEEPDGPPELDDAERRACGEATRRRLDGTDVPYRGGIAWPIDREISDTTWNAIIRKLDQMAR
jgi:hypothetical protein